MNNRLRVLRAERGWSQADLAERLGVSRQTVNALETGKYDPSLVLAFRIAWRDLLYQMYFIGVKSQSVVLITGAFTGMVLAAQTYFQFHKVTMDTATLAVVGVSMCSELGPVLTGLMVAGRVGAAMAAIPRKVRAFSFNAAIVWSAAPSQQGPARPHDRHPRKPGNVAPRWLIPRHPPGESRLAPGANFSGWIQKEPRSMFISTASRFDP